MAKLIGLEGIGAVSATRLEEAGVNPEGQLLETVAPATGGKKWVAQAKKLPRTVHY